MFNFIFLILLPKILFAEGLNIDFGAEWLGIADAHDAWYLLVPASSQRPIVLSAAAAYVAAPKLSTRIHTEGWVDHPAEISLGEGEPRILLYRFPVGEK